MRFSKSPKTKYLIQIKMSSARHANTLYQFKNSNVKVVVISYLKEFKVVCWLVVPLRKKDIKLRSTIFRRSNPPNYLFRQLPYKEPKWRWEGVIKEKDEVLAFRLMIDKIAGYHRIKVPVEVLDERLILSQKFFSLCATRFLKHIVQLIFSLSCYEVILKV